jgi:hypothetical protein
MLMRVWAMEVAVKKGCVIKIFISRRKTDESRS